MKGEEAIAWCGARSRAAAQRDEQIEATSRDVAAIILRLSSN